MALLHIARQYNNYADEYAKKLSVSLQSGNLYNLFTFLKQHYPRLKNKAWLDAGCGPGSLSKLRENIIPKSALGIDISSEMVRVAKQTNFYTECYVANLTNLEMVQDSSVDIYFSNSALHWLNLLGRDSFKASFMEAKRVLSQKGALAASISGTGTARLFMSAYHKVVYSLLKSEGEFSLLNPKGVKFNNFREDMLGSINLYEVVDILDALGFFIKYAVELYEPVYYINSSEYVKVVELYGKHIYLSPFDHYPIKAQDQIFDRIGKEFIKLARGVPYAHKQYMIYIIAVKE